MPELEALERRWRETFGTDLFRPRDEYDVDVHPESVRGRALALMDEAARVHVQFEAVVAAMPWYQRWPTRFFVATSMAWYRVTHA
jgi:hypothetical protein